MLTHAILFAPSVLKLVYNPVQVFIPTIKLLTDEQLKELGVKLLGERAELRRKCKESEHGTVFFNDLILCIFCAVISYS